MQSVYDYRIQDIRGHLLELSDYRGKHLLIVNVASACGYTGQYTQLQELYTHAAGRLVVLGCPCNDFGGQETGTEAEIEQFCSLSYGVTFPMTEKLQILGPDRHPIYNWLCQKELNGVEDAEVTWNFHKFLIDPDGSYYRQLPSASTPLDPVVLDWLDR